MFHLYASHHPAAVLREYIGSGHLGAWAWFDLPSLVMVSGTLIACRLSMGKLQNRYDWIPISLLIGVLWSLLGITAMLAAGFELDTFACGCIVALLPTLYACVFSLAVLVNRFWFFTILGTITACISMVLAQLAPTGQGISVSTFVVSLMITLLICLFCWMGCLCDMFYYCIAKHEYTGGLFRKRKLAWSIILAGPLVCISLYICVAMSVRATLDADRSAGCVNNMKQIGIALQKYHDEHGTFPPAYTTDAEGKPLHSWRTLILPYFDPEAIEPKWKNIYEQIRFDEPWDSEHNILFSKSGDTATGHFRYEMPKVYGCTMCCSGASEAETPYKMVSGENTIGNLTGTALSRIERALSETILLIESGQAIPWMSPSDFAETDFKTAVFANDTKQVNEIRRARYSTTDTALAKRQFLGGRHHRELNILFADGNVQTYYDWKLSLEEIEAMSRIRENEQQPE